MMDKPLLRLLFTAQIMSKGFRIFSIKFDLRGDPEAQAAVTRAEEAGFLKLNLRRRDPDQRRLTEAGLEYLTAEWPKYNYEGAWWFAANAKGIHNLGMGTENSRMAAMTLVGLAFDAADLLHHSYRQDIHTVALQAPGQIGYRPTGSS